MDWQEKIKYFVEAVLNVYSDAEYRYKLTVIDDHNILVTHPMESDLTNWSKDDVPSHWKEVGYIIIKAVIDRRIANYF